MMSNIKNIATMALLVVLLGFFANFAQNDYGLTMVKYGLAVFAYTMIFFMWNSLKSWRIFFLTLCSLFLMIEFSKDTLVNINSEYGVIAVITQLFIIILIWLFPIFLLITERKRRDGEKTLIADFIDACFIFVLGVGYFYKLGFKPGAAPILLLTLPYFFISVFRMITHLIKIFRKTTSFHPVYLLRFLLGLSIGAFVFKINHWPYSDFLINNSMFIFFLFLLLWLVNYRNESFSFWPGYAPLRYILSSFMIVSLYYLLSYFSLNPPVFLNVYPIAMYEYDGSFGSEKNPDKYETYGEYYRIFAHQNEAILENEEE